MDREILEEHLAQADRHVEEGWGHLDRQRKVIAELERDGHGAREARRLLHQFEEMQAMHIADRDRLRQELGMPPWRP
jgi:hypothetical protein